MPLAQTKWASPYHRYDNDAKPTVSRLRGELDDPGIPPQFSQCSKLIGRYLKPDWIEQTHAYNKRQRKVVDVHSV